jgi:beta-lactamase superfamily II metal-dependent hydrolase
MLKAHFLNVGKGNCTVIEFPSGRLSMIDIDNSRTDNDEDLTDPIDYYKNKFSNQSLFRFILTHPDMDHMSGLNKLSQIITFQNFWDTEHNKKMNSDDWENSPYDKNDWEKYLEFRQSTKNPQCLQLYQGATSECCWTQDGITIFSPTKKLVDLANDKEEYNHLSYVIKLQYNGVKVLFGGDATVEAWDEIHENYNDEDLQADIFLAPHHGNNFFNQLLCVAFISIIRGKFFLQKVVKHFIHVPHAVMILLVVIFGN